MVGLSINESTRTAATDGALSFSILVNNQRELTLGAAQSSVSGLLTAIREAPSNYADLLDAAAEAFETQGTAALKLINPPWTGANQATRDAIRGQIDAVLAVLLAAERSEVTVARDAAFGIASGAPDPSTERTLANDTAAAGDLLLTALGQLEGNEDATGLANLADARSQAAAALADAQSHLANLQSQDPLPTDAIARTQGTIAAAQSIIDAADAVGASTFVGPAGQAPTTYQLTSSTPPETYLSVWGSSGAISLTDANGNGILITSDGKVDTIPPGGSGWQFSTDSTFLLPDGTKVSIDPGSPASVLVTRGQQRISIDGLAPGQSPSVQQQNKGGIAADANRNDGYIFEMSGSLSSWTLAGSALGDVPGARETVATTPLSNERKVDVTLTPLPPELAAFLAEYGIDPATFDTDGDGLYSNEELQVLVKTLDGAVGGLQSQFDNALSNSLAALESLLKLNQFIEKIIDDADRRQANRRQLTAEERDQLITIQREIAVALAALRADRSQGEARPTLVGDALAILDQVEQVSPAPVPATVPPAPAPSPALEPPVGAQAVPPTPAVPGGPFPLPPPTGPQAVPPPGPPAPPADAASLALGQSLRRAERLLSGFADGLTSLRFVAPPPPPSASPPPVPLAEPVATGLPPPLSEGPEEDFVLPPREPAEETRSPGTPLPGFARPPVDLPSSRGPLPPEPPPVAPPGGVPAFPGLDGLPEVAPSGPPPPRRDPAGPTPPQLDPFSGGPGVPAFLRPDAPPPAPGTVPPATPAPVDTGTEFSDTPAPGPLPDRPVGLDRTAVPPPPGQPPPVPPVPPVPASGPADGVPPGVGDATPPGTRRERPSPGLEGAPPPEGVVPPAPAPVPPPAPAPVLLSLADVLAAALPARQPSGLPPIEGSRFSVGGPDPRVSPDTTFGSADGFQREYGRRLDAHRAAYETSLRRSGQVQTQVRQVVERFLVLVGQDEELRQVFTSDDLSDEQRATFKEKVQTLERELGVTWGGDPERTPQGETKLANRLLTSGMMI